MYAPSMYSEPCAKLTMRVTPKISVKPAATRNSADADARPFRSWIVKLLSVTRDALLGRPHLADDVIVRLVVLPVGVFPVDHHTLAVLDCGATHVGAHRRLMVDRAECDLAERRVDVEVAHRRHQLPGVGRSRLAKRRDGGLDRAVADDRPEPRIVVELRLVRVAEALVRRRVDRIPGITGDIPADRRFVLQRVEIFGLAAQQIENRTVLEQPAQLAFADRSEERRVGK